jgi:hypothetical protein
MFSIFRLEKMSAAELVGALNFEADGFGNVNVSAKDYGGFSFSYRVVGGRLLHNYTSVKAERYGLELCEVYEIMTAALERVRQGGAVSALK